MSVTTGERVEREKIVPARVPDGTFPTLVPVLGAVLVLFIALAVNGAFAIRHWAPITLFVLVVLASAARRPLSGPPLVAVAAIWMLAAWSLASALWGASPESAGEHGARTLLYAGLFALPLVTLRDRRSVQTVAAAALGGLAVITIGTFVHVLLDDESAFLAGRLDDPIGYRNGTAALFVLAFWPLLCVAATRKVSTLLRAPAFAIALLALGMALMTQSRGALIGFVAGGAVAVLVGPDRLRRAWLSIVALGAIAIASGTLLEPYQAFLDDRPVTASVIGGATVVLALVASAGLLAVVVLSIYDNGLRAEGSLWQALRRLTAGGLAVFVLIAGAGMLVAVGNPVTFAQDKYDEFSMLDTAAPTDTRLGSTGGQRYDIWRIALGEFKDRPIAGVGAGSYRFGYYRERSTDRNLSTPHSLPMALLSETGAVGALLFALFLGAIGVTFATRWRETPPAARRWACAAAAAGAVLIGQCLVDWLWEIPGLAGLGVLALGLAVAWLDLPEHAPQPEQRPFVSRTAGTIILALAVLVVTAIYLSDFHVRQARAAGERSAPAQLAAARTAARLNPVALSPKLLQAGALEELGRVDDAREALRQARRLEPDNFVLYGLIGDLETRAGRDTAARRAYRRALELNPGDVGLQQLARRTP
jgi:hypothetical protein